MNCCFCCPVAKRPYLCQAWSTAFSISLSLHSLPAAACLFFSSWYHGAGGKFFVVKQYFQAGTQSKQASGLGCWLQRCACALHGPFLWGPSPQQGYRVILSW